MRASVAVAALLLVGSSARAQTRLTLAPELTLDAGYSDNLFLDPSLTAATPHYADAIFDVRPSLLATLLRAGQLLTLDADYLERVTPSSGELRDLWLRVDWSSPLWHRLRLGVGGLYEHYETTQFADSTFDLGGGEARLRLVLATAWLQASYRIDARSYPDPSRNGQLDVDQLAAAAAHVRLHRLITTDVGFRYLHVDSNEPTAVLDRERVDVAITLRPTRWLTLVAAYAWFAQQLPNGAPPANPQRPGGPRSDMVNLVGVSLSVRPWRLLELFARYDFIGATSDAANGRYQLDQVLAGIAVGWDFSVERAPAPPPLRPSLNGREVTFRARARPGARVAVVGDWNGWEPAPLQAVGGDRYQGTYTLPPGRHAWALSVDGAPVVPPDAAAYQDDGFGGKNAVVDVP